MMARSNEAKPRLRAAILALSILLILPAVAVVVPSVDADTVTIQGARLPTPRAGTSAVWDGANAYVFGGWNDWPAYVDWNQVVRYTPGTSTVTIMSATLPGGRFGMSAIWDGSNAYLFGGWNYSCDCGSNQILRYSPSTDTLTVMSATLPTARTSTSAVWDGTNAYIFGGYAGPSSSLNAIVRYNPSTNTVTTMSAVLPTARWGTSAIWDGSNAYIFGGSDGSAQIVRYNPGTNTVTTMSATLPSGRISTSAAWDGSSAYVFGNSCAGGAIVRYVPSTNTVSTMLADLVSPCRFGTSAVWGGSVAYVFGGYNGITDEILKYNPHTPTVPQSLTASGGANANGGTVTLNWQAPAQSGSSGVTNYAIYRSTSWNGPFAQVAQVGNVLSYTDTGLAFNKQYYYTVAAINAAGESPQTWPAWAGTLSAPSAPRDLNAFAVSTVATGLEWQAPTTAGAGASISRYVVYAGACSACKQPRPPMDIPSVPGREPPTVYLDGGLTPGELRYYQVSAVNTLNVEGGPSNEAVASALSKPNAPPALGGYSQHDLLSTGTIPVGAILPNTTVGKLTVYDQGSNVCFNVTVAGTKQNLACVGRNFLGPVDQAIPRGDTPLGTQPNTLANASVSVNASYRWDQEHLDANHVSLLDGAVNAYAPVSPGDYEWFIGPGGQGAGLVIELTIYNNGQKVGADPIILPFVGQALAAAASSGGI